jgi:hypothetical protein
MIKYFRDEPREKWVHPEEMIKQEVHILQWAASGTIGGVYSSKVEAMRIAYKANKRKKWKHKFSEAVTGKLCEWVVKTYEVKGEKYV